VIIETIIKNPEESDGEQTMGYYNDLNNVKQQSEAILSRFKIGPVFSYGTHLKEDRDLLREFGLTKFIYTSVAMRGGAFPLDQVEETIRQVEEILEKDKKITSYSAKRRILSKMLRLETGTVPLAQRKRKVEDFLKKIIRSEHRRAAAQNKMLNKVFEYAESINPVWGGYYVLFGYSDLEKSDEKYNKDYIENGKLIVDMIVEEMKSKLGDDGDEKAENFFDSMFDVLSQYLSDKNFTDSAMYTDPVSFSEFKMALILEPNDPSSYYEKIRIAREKQMHESGDTNFKMVAWDDTIKKVKIEKDIHEW
jgi:hypothetical protein